MSFQVRAIILMPDACGTWKNSCACACTYRVCLRAALILLRMQIYLHIWWPRKISRMAHCDWSWRRFLFMKKKSLKIRGIFILCHHTSDYLLILASGLEKSWFKVKNHVQLEWRGFVVRCSYGAHSTDFCLYFSEKIKFLKTRNVCLSKLPLKLKWHN